MARMIDCPNCKMTNVPHRAKGRCPACHSYWYRTGRERPNFPPKLDRYCVRCDLWCLPHARGLCHNCYMKLWKRGRFRRTV